MTGYVEGYGVISEGETYHPSAFFDPAEKFKFAGDPEKQAEYQGELKSSTTQEGVNGVPTNPTEITAEQSNADLGTSRVHPDVPNVNVEFTAQPSLVVTKVEDGKPVELTPVTNVVGIEPNGETPSVQASEPTELLSDKDAATVEAERKNKQEADYQTLQDSEANVQHPEDPSTVPAQDEQTEDPKQPSITDDEDTTNVKFE